MQIMMYNRTTCYFVTDIPKKGIVYNINIRRCNYEKNIPTKK